MNRQAQEFTLVERSSYPSTKVCLIYYGVLLSLAWVLHGNAYAVINFAHPPTPPGLPFFGWTTTNFTFLGSSTDLFVAHSGLTGSNDFYGRLRSYRISSSGDLATTPTWSEAIPTARKIVTYDANTGAGVGRPFTWPLIASQYAALGSTDAEVRDRLDWLRGAAVAGLRVRSPTSFIGDISSGITYIGVPSAGYSGASYLAFRADHLTRNKMIYTGANDGMLHAFDANSGIEAFAYVPNKLFSTTTTSSSGTSVLRYLSNPSYTHTYFVDSRPMIADANLPLVGWRTMLIGSLGRGGRGVFALDVTAPDTTTETALANIVKWEFTDDDDAELGYPIFQSQEDPTNRQPLQITRLPSGEWVALIPNGIGGFSNRPYLFIIALNGGRPWITRYRKIAIGPAEPNNGLVGVNPVDTNGDGIPDRIYTLDLYCRLSRLDLTGIGITTGTITPPTLIYQAFDAGGGVQPCNSAPVVTTNPGSTSGDYYVCFNTGSNLGEYVGGPLAGRGDLTALQRQTVYCIRDDGTTLASGRGDLFPSVLALDAAGFVVGLTEPPLVIPPTHRGCYADFPTDGEEGVFNPSNLGAGAIVYTSIKLPTKTGALPGGEMTTYVLDHRICTRTDVRPDLTGDGRVDAADFAISSGAGSSAVGVRSSLGATAPYTRVGGTGTVVRGYGASGTGATQRQVWDLGRSRASRARLQYRELLVP